MEGCFLIVLPKMYSQQAKKHASFKYAINAIFMPIHPLLAQVKGAPAETICKNKN